jgi:CheY-like chemotaxis protein
MGQYSLQHRRILVVEDEYIIAYELRLELEDLEATVVGPVGNLGDAIALIKSGEPIDGAILDVNLAGQYIYPLADLLIERDVPFVFTTGYDASMIPDRFAAVVRCQKPVEGKRVTQALGAMLH